VGRLGRAHGTGGELVVRLLTNDAGRLDPGSVLDLDGRELTVTASRPHQDRWLVSFAGVTTRSAAEALAGGVLRAEAVTGDPDSYWVHDLIGAEVVDVAGAPHGHVTAVVANPASDLLELSGGALIPLRFAHWDPGAPGPARRLVVDGPRGLLGDPDAH
jgi:16S rRNA processing protein RimM